MTFSDYFPKSKFYSILVVSGARIRARLLQKYKNFKKVGLT